MLQPGAMDRAVVLWSEDFKREAHLSAQPSCSQEAPWFQAENVDAGGASGDCAAACPGAGLSFSLILCDLF